MARGLHEIMQRLGLVMTHQAGNETEAQGHMDSLVGEVKAWEDGEADRIKSVVESVLADREDKGMKSGNTRPADAAPAPIVRFEGETEEAFVARRNAAKYDSRTAAEKARAAPRENFDAAAQRDRQMADRGALADAESRSAAGGDLTEAERERADRGLSGQGNRSGDAAHPAGGGGLPRGDQGQPLGERALDTGGSGDMTEAERLAAEGVKSDQQKAAEGEALI